MSEIRSLADELRESIRTGKDKVYSKKSSKKAPPRKIDESLEQLFNAMHSHEAGNEKVFIRLDERTIFLFKQLKISAGIDMNKAYSYVIKAFLENTPELTKYIKDSLKTLDP
jgi:hypothetical protein